MGPTIVVAPGYHRGKQVAARLKLPEECVCNVIASSIEVEDLSPDITFIVVDFPLWPAHAKEELYRLAASNYRIVSLSYAMSTLN